MKALMEPQTIKISSKRQITIPMNIFREAGFSDYALVTWTSDGMLVQPLGSKAEDLTIEILEYLVKRGYSGEDLIEKYREMRPQVINWVQSVREAEESAKSGDVLDYDEMWGELKDEFDLHIDSNA